MLQSTKEWQICGATSQSKSFDIYIFLNFQVEEMQLEISTYRNSRRRELHGSKLIKGRTENKKETNKFQY